MTGQVAVVTGADTGIGLETARALAGRGCTIVMASMHTSQAEAAAADIKKTVPGADILIPAEINLASMQKTRDYVVATYKLLKGRPINILVNDAAMANNPHGYTTDDLDQNGNPFEMLFEVNYVNQWLLTDLLLPQLRASGDGRVINLVSKAYRMSCVFAERDGCMELKNLPPPVVTTDPNATIPVLDVKPSNYGIAKLLMVRWTEDLARRERKAGTNVITYSVDPGYVNTSMANESSTFWDALACTTEGRKGAPCPCPIDQGALTPAFLGIAPPKFITENSGQYFEWCHNASVTKCLDSLGDVVQLKCALDAQSDQEKLWDISANWVKDYRKPVAQQVAEEEAAEAAEAAEALKAAEAAEVVAEAATDADQ